MIDEARASCENNLPTLQLCSLAFPSLFSDLGISQRALMDALRESDRQTNLIRANTPEGLSEHMLHLHTGERWGALNMSVTNITT